MNPLVSVIIPCHNGGAYLREAVSSVLSQSVGDLECLIVDDGSTDDTSEISIDLVKSDARVQYHYNEQQGLPATRNFGIRNTTGEWIQFLDADDWLSADKLEVQLDRARTATDRRNTVIFSDYEVIFTDEDDRVLRTQRQVVGDLSNSQLLERMVSWAFKANVPLHANSVLFHRGVFEKKLFDESFKTFGDMELFVDLLLKDVEFLYTPWISMRYRVHETNMTKDRGRTRDYYLRYLEAIYKKDSKLLEKNPNLGKLTKEFLISRDKARLDKLVALISRTGVKYNVLGLSINSRRAFILPLLYYASILMPRRYWHRLWHRFG